jgi:hypothetical protein
MTRIPFDQFSKGYLEELLAPFGTVEFFSQGLITCLILLSRIISFSRSG